MKDLRAQIVEEAKSWIGTPYHHQAAVKGHGVDCAWMPIMVYKRFNLIPSEFNPGHYAPDWYMHRTEEIYLRFVETFGTRTENPQPGDFALFRLGRCACHGAIFIERDMVVHADRRTGKVEIACISTDLIRRLHSYWSAL